LETAQTLDEALVIVRGYLDPVFRGRTTGLWIPIEQQWFDSQGETPTT
jgi:hypothetical protein